LKVQVHWSKILLVQVRFGFTKMKRFIRVFGSSSGSVRHPALNAVSHFGAKQSTRCGGPTWRKTCKQSSFCVGVVWQTQSIQHLAQTKKKSYSASKTTIWPNHGTSVHQYWRLSGVGGGKPPMLGDFWKLSLKYCILDMSHLKFSLKIWNSISIEVAQGPLGPPPG